MNENNLIRIKEMAYNLFREIETIGEAEGLKEGSPQTAIYVSTSLLVSTVEQLLRDHMTLSTIREGIMAYHETGNPEILKGSIEHILRTSKEGENALEDVLQYALGLYQHYYGIWPEKLEKDLREGLKKSEHDDRDVF